MGELVDGVWKTGKLTTGGKFERKKTTFRSHIEPADVAAGRYHLYVAAACPWAHRTLITRALRGLEKAIGVTVLGPKMGENGWEFVPEDPDPIGGARYLYEVYVRAHAKYSGRVTVPVLWDKEKNAIVNNESREVMRILDVELASLAENSAVPTLFPEKHRSEIDRVLDEIYEPVYNGVYRAGFSGEQDAYEEAVKDLFAELAKLDSVLGQRPYLCGDVMTEADIALFTTCLRFDLVYYSHLKCNVKRLRDHENLWRFTRRMYQHPQIAATCDLDAIKTHYYWSQDTVNPTRIVPVGPSDYATALNAPALNAPV